MKSNSVLFSLVLITLISILSIRQYSFAKEGGAPSGNTGSPGDEFQTCAHVDCHTGSAVPIENILSTDIPASGYKSGIVYTITVTLNHPGTKKFGFQVSPQDLEGNLLGDLDIINSSQTKLTGGGKYITHTSTGSNGTDLKTWSFAWTSEDVTGDVTFYTAVNFANDDEESSGDSICTSFLTVTEDSTNIPLTVSDLELYADLVNPVAEFAEIFIQTESNQPIHAEVINMNGHIIALETGLFPEGVIRISMSDQPPGIYFFRLTQDEQSIVRQFVKL